MSDYKQVIIVRQDLKMPKGKTAAQAAHASVEAVLKSDKQIVKEWRQTGMAKIVLKVNSVKELIKLNQEAKDLGLIKEKKYPYVETKNVDSMFLLKLN